MLQIKRLPCDVVKGGETRGDQLLPGLSAQPDISLEPWCGQKASPSHRLGAGTLLQPFTSCCQELGLCGQLVLPRRWAEAKPSHRAWHLGCSCVCREVAERECALQHPLPPRSPTATGRGLAEAPQHDAKQRHLYWAACSSPQGPGSPQTWGNAEKIHLPGAAKSQDPASWAA